jgi:hypothetical protein
MSADHLRAEPSENPEHVLKALQIAIDRYVTTCAAGQWLPEADEHLWRVFFGEDAPRFPLESAPPEHELRINCAVHQCKHEGHGIPLPLVPDQAMNTEGKIRFLKDIVTWMTQQRGNDLCWEHAETLRHACRLTRGLTDEPEAARPSLHTCMASCNNFAFRLYAALGRRT